MNASPIDNQTASFKGLKNIHFRRYDTAFPKQRDAVADDLHFSFVSRRPTRYAYEDESPDYNLSVEYYLNFYRFWDQFKDGSPPQQFLTERIAKLGGGTGDFERVFLRLRVSESVVGECLDVVISSVQEIVSFDSGKYLEPLPPNKPYWRRGGNPADLLNYMSEAMLCLLATSKAIAGLEKRYNVRINHTKLLWQNKISWYFQVGDVWAKNNIDLARDVIPFVNVTPLADGNYLFGMREVMK